MRVGRFAVSVAGRIEGSGICVLLVGSVAPFEPSFSYTMSLLSYLVSGCLLYIVRFPMSLSYEVANAQYPRSFCLQGRKKLDKLRC